MRLRAFLIALLCLASVGAHAHPHVWVDAAAEILYDAKGRISAIRHHWRFDEGFSAYALQGLDSNRDGKNSAEELAPLAKENVESLKDFDYFTLLTVGDYVAGFAAPTDYHLELTDDRLLLHFTLPLASPLLTRGTATLEVGDPEYYVAFSIPSFEAVRLVDAPAACRLTVHAGEEPDAAAAAALAEIGPDQRALPPGMQALAAGTENSAEVNCGAPASPPSSPGEAVSAMAGSNAASGDLTALPAAPTSSSIAEAAVGDASAAADQAAEVAQAEPPVASPATPAPPTSPGLLRRWSAWIGGLQTQFSRELTAALKGLSQGEAFWWLGGISFLYGIVHAAGPGHGKVVISTYLVANEARIRRGVVIAFIAAFVQAVVAVGIIGLMAVILNMTSMAIDSTAKIFEAGSFALVAGLGLYLLARKGRAAWSMLKGGDAHAHHHHHGHGHDAAREGGRGLGGAAAAILSVGIRPCSGALIVLVFALSQGIFWAGVASTFVMALGTAITVALLAALAVGAKGVAQRLARGDDRRAGQVMLGLELAAALLITVLGVVLFVGSVYA